jgi:dCMP deaminase
VLHAESNALMKLAKHGSSSDGATLYTTLSPCFECAKLIIQSGIKSMVYGTEYRDASPLRFLYMRPGFVITKMEK